MKNDELKEAIGALAAKAMFRCNIRKPHLRTAWEVISIGNRVVMYFYIQFE